MAGYIGSKASVVSSGAERKKTFAITTTTTVLTGLSYTPTFVHLFHNGVRLVDGTDYTATDGTSITLTSAAESGDEVVVISYATFQVADAYTKAEADSAFVSDPNGAVTVDGSGNVGIGTASPTTALHVNGGTDPSINITGTGGTATIKSTDRDLKYDARYGTHVWVSNGTTERMRIDASGNVLVGKTVDDLTTEGVRIRANAVDVSRSSSAALNVCRTTTNGSAVVFYRDGAGVGSISVTTSATAYNTSSDYRLKENITPVQGAADIVKAMQPVTYTFKSDGSWHDGFLAHELQELHPRAVTGSKDAVDEEGNPEYQGVDYSKLTPILTAALQEALNKIDALEARLTALEAKP